MSKFQTVSQGGEIKEQVGGSNPLTPKTRNFYVDAGQRRTIVPVDDDLIAVRRHKVWLQNPASTDIYGFRLTCACPSPFQYSDIEPQTCRACNGMAMGFKALSLKAYYYVSVISEGELLRKDKRSGTYVPTGIWDYKYLLELDEKGRQRWEELKATYGRLVGQRINIYRSSPPRGQKNKTPQYGDAWTVLPHQPGFQAPLTAAATDRDRWLWLRAHFYRSPAIARIIEYSQRSGTGTGVQDHESAVANLIAPINYDEEFDNYTEQSADRLVAIAAGKPVTMDDGDAPLPPVPSGAYSAPPMAQTPAQYANQTMAPADVPTYAPQQPQPVPQPQPQMYVPSPSAPQPAPAGAPMMIPPAPSMAPAGAPPPVPDPVGASPAAGGNYAFDQGWSPGFPPPSAAPAAPPQVQAQQAQQPQQPSQAQQPQALPPPPPGAGPAPVPQYTKAPF